MTFLPVLTDQIFLELFGECFPSLECVCPKIFPFREPIRPDSPPCRVLHLECLKRYTLFTDIACSSRRMVVPIFFFQFFRRDKAMFDDVLDNRSRTFCCHASQDSEDFLRYAFL